MTVMDVAAYAGYTTEMLAAAVGVGGVVYSQNTQRVLERYADGYYQRTMDERLANNRLPNVVLHIHEYEDHGLEGQLDLAFLGNLLHDFYNFEGEEVTLSYLRSIGKALKPGGVLTQRQHDMKYPDSAEGSVAQEDCSLHVGEVHPGIGHSEQTKKTGASCKESARLLEVPYKLIL